MAAPDDECAGVSQYADQSRRLRVVEEDDVARVDEGQELVGVRAQRPLVSVSLGVFDKTPSTAALSKVRPVAPLLRV